MNNCNQPFNQSASNEGRKMAETYVEVLTHSVQAHTTHLTQSPQCQDEIASKFNQVFANDTPEVVSDYALQRYEELKHSLVNDEGAQ